MGRSVALCIGVDLYEDPGISNLRCAQRDATRLAYALESLGFEATELTGDLSADEIFRQLRLACAKVQSPQDRFVFFFAGHGKTVKQGRVSDQVLLLPSASLQVLERGIVHGAPGLLSTQALIAATAGMRGPRILSLDTCQQPIPESEFSHRSGENSARFEGEAVFRGLAGRTTRIVPGAGGLTILNSCQDGERAQELSRYPGGGHGAFTAALLEAIKDATKAGQSLKLSAEFVGGELKRKMDALIQEYGSGKAGQTPLLVGDAVTLYEPEEGEPNEDERLWKLASALDTIEGYERYVKESRECLHMDQALKRIAELKKSGGRDLSELNPDLQDRSALNILTQKIKSCFSNVAWVVGLASLAGLAGFVRQKDGEIHEWVMRKIEAFYFSSYFDISVFGLLLFIVMALAAGVVMLFLSLRRDKSTTKQLTSILSRLSPPESMPETDLRTLIRRAERGEAPAQNNLGAMYQDGHGVAQDESSITRSPCTDSRAHPD